MALRKAILTKCAVWPSEDFVNYILDIFANPRADKQRFDNALLAWQEMRTRQVEYVAQAAEIAAGLYYEGMTATAGLGGDIAAFLNFPQTIETAGQLAQGAFELLRYTTGRLADWITEPPVTAGPLLDGGEAGNLAPPPEGGPELIPARARAALKFAGLVQHFEMNDVVRPLVRIANQTIESPIGFVWRRDLLPGAEDTLKILPHVAHGRTTMILGTAQQTSGTHAATINRWAKKIVDDAPNKHYMYLGMNRSTRTLLDDGLTQGRKVHGEHSRHRPDIVAVYLDPATNSPKVELYEVPSGAQQGDHTPLVQMMQTIMAELPAAWRTNVTNIILQDPT